MLKKLENQVTFFTSNQINEKCFKNELESLCGQKKFNDINQKELAIISKKKFKEKVKEFYARIISIETKDNIAK